jgi:hypothetical protein
MNAVLFGSLVLVLASVEPRVPSTVDGKWTVILHRTAFSQVPPAEQKEVKSVPPKPVSASEHLVIVIDNQPEAIARKLREQFHVTQSVSPRVFLVRGDPSNSGVLEGERFRVFATPLIPEEVLESLDDKEALFVSAWRERLQQSPKRRKGEGLNWDHPDFKPPR